MVVSLQSCTVRSVNAGGIKADNSVLQKDIKTAESGNWRLPVPIFWINDMIALIVLKITEQKFNAVIGLKKSITL